MTTPVHANGAMPSVHLQSLDLSAIINHLSDAMLVVDPQQQIILWNQAAEALLGWPGHEVLGRHIDELLTISYASGPERAKIAQALRETGEWQGEISAFHRHGRELNLEGSSRVVRDASGQITHIVSVMRDVRVRKQAEAAQRRLRILAEASQVFAAVTDDVATLARTVTHYIAIAFGDLCSLRLLSPDGEWLLAGYTAHPDPEAHKLAATLAQSAHHVHDDLSGRAVQTAKTQLLPSISSDAARANLSASVHPYIDHYGIHSLLATPILLHSEVIGVISMARSRADAPYTLDDQALLQDFAERVALSLEATRAAAAERDARWAASVALDAQVEAFALLNMLFANAPIGLAFINRNYEFVRINESLAAMNGPSVGEHLGRRVDDVLPHIANQLMPIYHRILTTGQPLVDCEIVGETPAAPGRVRHWLASYYPITGHDIRPIGIGIVVNETTERVERAQRQREDERRFRMLAENAQDLIFRYRLDPPGFDYVNAAVTDLSGYTPEDHYAGRVKPASTLHPDDRQLFAESLRTLSATPTAFTVRFVHTDGRIAWMEHRVWLVSDEHGQPVAHEGIARNVTAAKQAEQQLQAYAEEMRALSLRLVQAQEEERRSLAHELHDEVGQLLTGLNMVLEAESAASYEQLRAKMRSAQQTVSDLTAQVRQLSLDLRPSLLDDLGLLPTLLWHFRRYTEHTSISVNFKHSGLDRILPPPVVLAAYRIVQEGLTNIARYAQVSSADVQIWLRDGHLMIALEDQGRGFALDRTLAERRSIGIVGMSERATLLGGQCVIDSTPGEGTRVFATLPL